MGRSQWCLLGVWPLETSHLFIDASSPSCPWNPDEFWKSLGSYRWRGEKPRQCPLPREEEKPREEALSLSVAGVRNRFGSVKQLESRFSVTVDIQLVLSNKYG